MAIFQDKMQMSTEISSTNILKHLDIKVRENTRMQQMSTEISSTNILKHLDIKVRENTRMYTIPTRYIYYNNMNF
jgi:hypothetical protein